MSEQIDWSKAPADATHHKAEDRNVFELWLKPGYAVRVSRGSSDWVHSSEADRLIAECGATARPTTPSWSGEGLPPVGVKVLIMNPEQFAITDYGQEFVGEECTVRAVFVNDLDYSMVAVEKVGGACCCFLSEMCFPIRPPEQIAADEREAAIDQMINDATNPMDDRMIFEKYPGDAFIRQLIGCLYSAGYRKP